MVWGEPNVNTFKGLFFKNPETVACVARCSVRGEWGRAVAAIDAFQPSMEISATAGGCSAFRGTLFLSWEALREVDANAPAYFQLRLEREGGTVRMALPLDETLALQTALLMNAGVDFALQYAFSSKLHNPTNHFANKRLDNVLQRTRPPAVITRLYRDAPGCFQHQMRPIVAFLATAPLALKMSTVKALEQRCIRADTQGFWDKWLAFCKGCHVSYKIITKRRFSESKANTLGLRRVEGAEHYMLLHQHDFGCLALTYLFGENIVIPGVWSKTRQLILQHCPTSLEH